MKTESIKPTGMNVLVKYLTDKGPEERTVGGIYIPQTHVQKPNNASGVRKGVVLAVGNGKNKRGETVGLNVSVGDTVLVGLYNGIHMVCDGGEECCLIEDGEVIATIVE